MDGLTFQRFLMATFCVICQSVTRGIKSLCVYERGIIRAKKESNVIVIR